MRRLYQIPVEHRVTSETILAYAPTSAGEAPVAVASCGGAAKACYRQITVSEFSDAYRVLLVAAPLGSLLNPKAYTTPELHELWQGHGFVMHGNAPDLMVAIDTVWALEDDQFPSVYPGRKKWYRSPFLPEGQWEYVPTTLPYDYRTIAQRQFPKLERAAKPLTTLVDELYLKTTNLLGTPRSDCKGRPFDIRSPLRPKLLPRPS